MSEEMTGPHGGRALFARSVQVLALPFAACLILTGIHAYLGIHVLSRKVIFVDIALAQIAEPPGRSGRRDQGQGTSPDEWLASVTRSVVLPAIREELAELQALAGEGDHDAFIRFQALNREAVSIERRAREARTEESTAKDDADGLIV